MPGICGIVSAAAEAVDRGLLAEMLRRVTHHSWYQVEQRLTPSGRAALGRSTLGFVNNDLQPAQAESGQVWAVMDGEIHDSAAPQADRLLQRFGEQSRATFAALEGKFAAAIWNEDEQRLLLVNDRFGMKPLYYAHVGGKLLFASEIKALLADPEVSRTPSVPGLAEFFTFGHLLGESTLLESVRVLPPAAWLVYDAREDRLSVDRYWRLSASEPAAKADAASQVDRLCTALEGAVRRRTQGTQSLGLSLSGGLDGRTILAAIPTDSLRLKSVCMGMAGSLDHRSARQLAELAHCDHHTHVLDAKFLSQFEQHLRYMVHLTDGQYLDQCIVLPTLPLYRQLGIEVLLRGHAGELLHMDKAYNFSMDAEALSIRDEAGLKRWLLNRLCAYMLEGVEGSLFVGSTPGEIQAMASDSLSRAVGESAAITSPLQRISHLFITHRLRRETAVSLAMFNSVVETRVPFVDGGVIEALMAIPPEMKLGDRLQSEFLKRHKPEFLNVINSNTGAPMGASELRRKLATLRMKVFGKLGVPGYQPYERLGLWLRRELKPLVRQVLLSEACLSRGIFTPDVVRSVVERHENGSRNHTFLLMALMIFELGQREFIDRPCDDPSLAAPSLTSSV
jgi:asparagine synthase (glutamine-hydrolysing)